MICLQCWLSRLAGCPRWTVAAGSGFSCGDCQRYHTNLDLIFHYWLCSTYTECTINTLTYRVYWKTQSPTIHTFAQGELINIYATQTLIWYLNGHYAQQYTIIQSFISIKCHQWQLLKMHFLFTKSFSYWSVSSRRSSKAVSSSSSQRLLSLYLASKACAQWKIREKVLLRVYAKLLSPKRCF